MRPRERREDRAHYTAAPVAADAGFVHATKKYKDSAVTSAQPMRQTGTIRPAPFVDDRLACLTQPIAEGRSHERPRRAFVRANITSSERMTDQASHSAAISDL
jgi:hypothetical protein